MQLLERERVRPQAEDVFHRKEIFRKNERPGHCQAAIPEYTVSIRMSGKITKGNGWPAAISVPCAREKISTKLI